MLKSIQLLFKHPYNKTHKTFALTRLMVWKSIKFLKLKDVTFRIWNNKKILLNYDSFQCMWIMYNYIVDWEEFMFIKRFLKSDDQVCDIGANMGFYTIWMSKFITEGTIHAFEPDDLNFERFNKNILLNKIADNVKPNKCIVSESSGQLNFTTGLDGENHITNTAADDSLIKDTISLDLYALKNSVKNFKFIKIDTEGFELFVLKGAKQLMAENKISVIQLEINNSVKNSNTKIEDLIDFINSNNYILCFYNSNLNKLVKTTYTTQRDNYFATADVEKINDYLNNNA